MPDVSAFCEAVMRAVAAIAADKCREDYDRAVEVLREEIKAFFFEPRYADHRDCVMRRSLSDRTIVAAVAAEVVAKL